MRGAAHLQFTDAQNFKAFPLKFRHLAFTKDQEPARLYSSFPSSSAYLCIFISMKEASICQQRLFQLPTVNLNSWVRTQVDSTSFSPGTSAALQTQIVLAEMIRGCFLLSVSGPRHQNKTHREKKKKKRSKVGGTRNQADDSRPPKNSNMLVHVSIGKQTRHLQDSKNSTFTHLEGFGMGTANAWWCGEALCSF